MTGIERIKKIKNFRIFHDFMWPKNLIDFKRYNLIYGWNGSGKSTISNMLRSIEKRTPITEAEVCFKISGKDVDGKNLDKSSDLPQVRVFNKEFIDHNVFSDKNEVDPNEVDPIVILGEKNIEKQERLKSLINENRPLIKAISELKEQKDRKEKEIVDFCKEQGKSIKDYMLETGGAKNYNNYDKRKFREKCNEILELPLEDQKTRILSAEALNENYTKAKAEPKKKLPSFQFSYFDTLQLTEQVRNVLKKTVVSQTIKKLESDEELSKWMEQGLEKHKKEESTTCLFCEQPLPENRINELEAHFNAEYKSLNSEINSLKSHIESQIEEIEQKFPPKQFELYNELQKEYSDATVKFFDEKARVTEYLKKLTKSLEEKSSQPFQQINKNFEPVSLSSETPKYLNDIINRHNTRTDDFTTSINNACQAIEESKVAENLQTYKQFTNACEKLEEDINSKQERVDELEAEMKNIEKEISDHRIAVDELNKDLQGYLGRDELTFKLKENGYQIFRSKELAQNLSEGEKTAIAFLYFLKTLKDNTFSLSNGIVVVDDPVSSLDTNSLFSAFGFMKDRTKDAGQLFILTHNHSFFRQVKNWFKYENQKARYYMLRCSQNTNPRTSSIVELDLLLRNYESDYHYLFSLIYKAVYSVENNSLENFYHLPNIARRFLESFLAFRQPAERGALSQKINSIEYDEGKKVKLLRFLHTYSHSDQIADPEHDPSILLETKKILKDLLELIKNEDERHYSQMKSLFEKTRKKQ